MPKSIIIEPERVFVRDMICFSVIPANAYDRTIEQELAEYSAGDLMNIWRDMCAIREFETALQEIKTRFTSASCRSGGTPRRPIRRWTSWCAAARRVCSRFGGAWPLPGRPPVHPWRPRCGRHAQSAERGSK